MGSDVPSGQGGCSGGDRGQYHICDDIDPWGCYDKQIRDDCCETCSSFRLSPPIPVSGCDYGDKRAGCDAIFLGQCYQNHTRYECCQYCHDNKTGLQGCQYGDRIETCDQELVLECYKQQFQHDCCQYCDENETGHSECLYGDRIEDCIREDCYTYSQFKRNTQCCKTCKMSPNPGPTQNTQLPPDTTDITTWTELTTGSTRIVNSSTVSAGSGGNNMGLIVGVSVGAVCLVLVLIVAIICWRRRRNKDLKHLSPITDKMYNDYKLSKRAPVPEPRDIQRPKSGSKQKLIRQDSEVYAYINPNDVASIPSKTGTVINPQNGDKRQSRNEDDPLPPTPGNTPGDYLELKVVDKYGYMEPVEKHKTISTPYSEPYSDNQATLYPHKTGEPPYKNQL